jgi:hypothetical protein
MHALINGEEQSKIVEVDNERDVAKWKEENPEWVDHKMKLKKQEVLEPTDLFKKEEVVEPEKKEKPVKIKPKETTVEEDFTVIKKDEDDKLNLDPDILKQVVALLKGNIVGVRRGLSLTSFASLYGYNYSDVEAKKALKPDYEKLLKKLQEKDEIELKRKVWVYKGVSFKKRITKKNRPKR